MEGRPNKAVIKNPYARKTPSAPKQPPPAPTVATAPRQQPSLPPQAAATPYVATTFSQAFAVDNDNDSVTGTKQSPLSTKQQQQNAVAATHANLTDREMHVVTTQQPHVLYVSPKQQGNAVLQYIRNVPMATSRMVPDFVLSATRCALFLSCKYHALYPHYIHGRIAALGNDFEFRLLLVLVDVSDNAATIRQLNKLAVLNNLTLLLTWTAQEAARYLETYKALDGRDASGIQKRQSTTWVDQAADFLTACPTVNKSDAAALLCQFQSLAQLAKAAPDDLALVPGMGQVKVKRLYEAWHAPFSSQNAARRKRRLQDDNDNNNNKEEAKNHHDHASKKTETKSSLADTRKKEDPLVDDSSKLETDVKDKKTSNQATDKKTGAKQKEHN